MTNEGFRLGILFRGLGDSTEKDLAWLDYSLVTDIVPDGKQILITESGEGGGAAYSAYLRRTDGTPAIRLGEGATEAFSPDGRWAATLVHPFSDSHLVIVPTGVGESRTPSPENLTVINADWTPDGKRLVFTATEPGRGTRLFLRDAEGGKPQAITPEGYSLYRGTVTPDGKAAAVRGPDRRIYMYPLAGGEPQALVGLTPDESPMRFSADGRVLYVQNRTTVPSNVYRYDLATRKKELWKRLAPSDLAGVNSISRCVVTPDGSAFAYSYTRVLSFLQLVDGMR